MTRSLPSSWVLALVACLAVTLTGCVNAREARAKAADATAQFHTHFNDGRFDTIYALADPAFQKTMTAQQFDAFLGPSRTQLGSFQRVAKPGAWVLNPENTTGTFVTLTDESMFTHGSAQEVFVWRVATTCTLFKYTLNNVNVPSHPSAPVKAVLSTRPVQFMPIHASVEHLEALRRYYRGQLGIDVPLLPELVPDRAAWSPDRRQWSAEGLAEQVRQAVGNQDAVVIGITGDDIYLRRRAWQFAFGWRADNRVAVVSYARMDPRFFKEPADDEVLRHRLLHMVTKDLGLMWVGLEASPDPASPVYQNIGGLEELDAMGDDLVIAGFPVVTR